MPTRIIGQPVNRVDGRAKVTGRANYAADNSWPDLVYACGVVSTVASAESAEVDAGAAALPGVLGVWHHGNFPKLYRSPNDMEEGNRVGEVRPPFEDDRIYYSGQFVAVVAAETFEQARAASRLVRIHYQGEQKPAVSLADALEMRGAVASKDKPDQSRGDAGKAWEEGAIKIDATYTTPVEVHNPMEMHAAVARWSGENLEVYDSTQWVVGQRKALAKVLGVPAENVTVHSPYIGGGFGGKLFLWPHTVIAAVLARELKRPVKFVLERKNEFTTVGHRPETRQRMRAAATADGRLVSLRHETFSQNSLVHDFLEACGDETFAIYNCPNVAITHRLVPANVGAPTPMRAPGAAPGSFALECAMDELAIALKLDPFEFRRRNLSFDIDQEKKLPWSSNGLRKCLQIVSDRFGWSRRTAAPGSMREGDEILGWGMAVAAWPSDTGQASVLVQLRDDGTARVSCATQDIGTGTYTVAALTAAEVLGLPVEKIEVALGNSSLPPGPISGGSMVTATIVPAVAQAARKASVTLLKAATAKGAVFAGQDPKSLQWRSGEITVPADGRHASFAEVLKSARLASVDGEGRTPAETKPDYSFHSFGVHAVEVRWDPGIARLRVARVVGAFDTGRIINRKGALNQIDGAIMMGLGMALLEESVYDPHNGRVVTDNVADYLLPVNADSPEIDVTLLDEPDPHIGEFGAKGMGEIGITGIAAAIVNAVHHATGRRIRDLPVRIEKLLA